MESRWSLRGLHRPSQPMLDSSPSTSFIGSDLPTFPLSGSLAHGPPTRKRDKKKKIRSSHSGVALCDAASVV